MKLNVLFIMCLCCLCCSCSHYTGTFDCPPGKGVHCKSVTEIEKMIIETEDKEADIFIPGDCKKKNCRRKVASYLKGKETDRKVWVAGSVDSSGNYVEEHYIYFKSEEGNVDGDS
jgi:hypothetical protein